MAFLLVAFLALVVFAFYPPSPALCVTSPTHPAPRGRVRRTHSKKLAALRLLSSAAALTPDYAFLNALVEQDTVANLRYGVLVLLALSSLGVYSIILAG
jgi:NADH:ubiquinone oxidoreductase subunit H